jgi:SAM-dependent methyltransferase
MTLSRRQATAAFLLPLMGACAQTPEKEEFKPTVGQQGKDVIWVPTPDAVVDRMLDMAQVRPGERLVDLGSGDGKIAIAAAKRGARARGIEYNPDMVQLSRRNARAAGVNVDFQQGDIFVSDFTDADVITLYLLPTLNERLRPILLKMKPGTRVTSHEFLMGDWPPDRTDDVSGRRAHLWIVPAQVAGNWTVRIAGEQPLQVHLQQQYQKLEGHATIGSQRVPLEAPTVRGAAVGFAVPQAGRGSLRVAGTADHSGQMRGEATLPGGERRAFTASRA